MSLLKTCNFNFRISIRMKMEEVLPNFTLQVVCMLIHRWYFSFLAGKDRTQEMFFHNIQINLHTEQEAISIMTSYCPPRGFGRFGGGSDSILDSNGVWRQIFKLPEFETRVAIIDGKNGVRKEIVIPEIGLEYFGIFSWWNTRFRELEGNSNFSYCTFFPKLRVEISLELGKSVMKKHSSRYLKPRVGIDFYPDSQYLNYLRLYED